MTDGMVGIGLESARENCRRTILLPQNLKLSVEKRPTRWGVAIQRSQKPLLGQRWGN